MTEQKTRSGPGFIIGGITIRSALYLSVILGLVLLAAPAMATINGFPVAGFSANDTAGPAPLPVLFTDQSSYASGWSWFFGDETFTQPWTEMNASSGWEKRAYHSSVALPDGSIVLMGGTDLAGITYADTWRSTDKGSTWVRMNASAGWGERDSHTSVALPDGSIVLMGGYSGGTKSDVWRSTDKGVLWTLVNGSAEWPARTRHTSVALPDGSIVLMGGDWFNELKNDTWRSTDMGNTWTLMNASPGWPARNYYDTVALPDGSIVLMGGFDGLTVLNDTWRSTDMGNTWALVNASSGWSARSDFKTQVTPDGSIILSGGSDGIGFPIDIWRSADRGATWTRVNANAGWGARSDFSSVVLPDGSIVFTGGSGNAGRMNDTWRFQPAGSILQNPVHTYTEPGTYTVTQQVFNPLGYDSERKAGYITVTGGGVPENIGLYRPLTRMWYLDYDNNGLSNYKVKWGDSTDIPVAGDWDGDNMD
jgi:hypothetical protein